jgi:hypothetical protein
MTSEQSKHHKREENVEYHKSSFIRGLLIEYVVLLPFTRTKIYSKLLFDIIKHLEPKHFIPVKLYVKRS